MRSPVIATLMLTLSVTSVVAQERDTLGLVHVPPIVVTVSRVPTSLEDVGAAVTVITRQEIERRQYRTVTEALRDVPALAVVQTGGFGGVVSIFARGGNAQHVVVLVDGVELNDPSTPAGAYDFAGLLADDVERIEIVRGPQSTLYGSNAMAGVIHILTRDDGGPARAKGLVEAGSFGTVHGSARVAGSAGDLGYALQAGRRQTDGISAARGGEERDAGETTSLSGSLTWHIGEVGEVTASLRGRDGEAEIDQGGGAEADDPNFLSDARELVGLIEGRASLAGGRWETQGGVAITRHDRETRDEPDPSRPATSSRGVFDGDRWRISWQSEVALGAGQRLVAGVDHEVETAHNRFTSESEFGPFESELAEVSARTTGFFAENLLAFGSRTHVSAGARVDDHSRFGGVATYRVSPVLNVAPALRVRGAYGTGFRAPALSQLLDPLFGNRDLEAERSMGWELGLDMGQGEKRLGVTWFRTRYEDLIVFDGEGLRNVGAAESRGLETAGRLVWATGVRIDAAYTYLHTEEETGADAGRPLLRRPRHALSLGLGYDGMRANLGLLVRWVGAREDLDFSVFPAARVELDDYVTAGLTAAYRWNERLSLFARVENLTGSRYEEILRFGTPGRALYAGVSAGL